jgi:hypothetical protein
MARLVYYDADMNAMTFKDFSLVVLDSRGCVVRYADAGEAVEFGQANDRGSFPVSRAFERATRLASGVVVDRMGDSRPSNQPWMD